MAEVDGPMADDTSVEQWREFGSLWRCESYNRGEFCTITFFERFLWRNFLMVFLWMKFNLGFVQKIRNLFGAMARRLTQLHEGGPAQTRWSYIDNDQ